MRPRRRGVSHTLFAAAVAGFTLCIGAADEAPETLPPRAPDDAPPPEDKAEPQTIDVIGQGHQDKAHDRSSAGKIALPIRETPQSVTVITHDSLEMRHVNAIGQALELSAGVTQHSGNGAFAGVASFGFNETTIRGIDIDSVYDSTTP